MWIEWNKNNMKVLALSCSTGGGHNTCAHNIVNGLKEKGITAIFQNYLELFDTKTQKLVEEFYYKSLLCNGHLFEGIYKLGELYSKTKLTSPVYLLNKYGKEKLKEQIFTQQIDLCICTHLYPALALTELKKEENISFLFVGTDYTCIPFTNEIHPDFFVIPTEDLKTSYEKQNIEKEKLLPFGIPVLLPSFSKKELITKLNCHYPKNILLMSGSMGFGNIKKIVKDLLCTMDFSTGLFVICGSNHKLYEELILIKDERLQVFGFIPNVLEYIFISDLILTKPGGLSTTEVAVLQKPLIHICPIPGVETYNANYFSKKEMAILETDTKKIANTAISLLNNSSLQEKLKTNLKQNINANSLEDLCHFILKNYNKKN